MIQKGILCGKSSGPSCRLLRDYLFEKTGTRYLITNNKSKIKNVIIRYGNAGAVIGEDTNLNSRSAIILLGNKKSFSELMIQKGVNVPHFLQTVEPPNEYPVLIRKTLFGFGGKGIVYCPDEQTFMSNYQYGLDYWTPYINVDREFRFHCLGGKVRKIFLKQPNEGNEEDKVKNSHNCHFSQRNVTFFQSAIQYVENNILPFLGASFVGLDVGLNEPGNNFGCVFEGNSAPGISNETVKLYGDFIIEQLFGSIEEL